MNILLVNVHYEQNMGLFQKYFLQSLTLRQLVAITPKKYVVDILEDIKPLKINYDGDYDIIGISAVTPSALHAYKIADEFRKRGKIVVLGGYHPSALPEEAKQHADSVVIGEAESTWPKLLDDVDNGKIEPYYRNKSPVDPKLIPNPERKRYISYYTPAVKTTRGCPIGCEFCSISHKEFGHVFRKKPIEKVVEDIESIKEKVIFFADPSLTTDVEYTKQLFRELIGLNKKFTYFQGNVNILAKDDELLKLASEAGCIYWHVGFESVSQKTLDFMGKTTNKVEEYVAAIKKINNYGMAVFGEFVFGFDTDAPDIFEKTGRIIEDWNIIPGFQVLTPYPGSPLFNRLDREGRILTRDWAKYTTRDVVFQPKHMTPQHLEEGVNRLVRNFYSYNKAIKRTTKAIKIGFHPFLFSLSTNLGKAIHIKLRPDIFSQIR